MPDTINHPESQIDISEPAIRALVNSAVQSCYGIVGVGRTRTKWAVTRRFRASAIEIRQREESVVVRIPVIVEYGLPVVAVAQNLVKSVTYQLQQALGSIQPHIEVQVVELRQSASAPVSPA